MVMRDPNNHLSFDSKGVYRLTRVKDAHCAGDILHIADVFEVDFKPRPTVNLVEDKAMIRQGVHRGFCAGEEDNVALRFKGK